MPHQYEPEWVSRGRRYFVLTDRYHGRIKDVKASKLLRCFKNNLNPSEQVIPLMLINGKGYFHNELILL